MKIWRRECAHILPLDQSHANLIEVDATYLCFALAILVTAYIAVSGIANNLESADQTAIYRRFDDASIVAKPFQFKSRWRADEVRT